VKFLVTAGPEADITHAPALIAGQEAEVVIAAKAFDKKGFVSPIEQQGAEACIPSLANRKEQREYDRDLYQERNRVERFINRLKQYRRVATRYEKPARNFLAFVHVASVMVLLLEPNHRKLPHCCPHGLRASG
jgi:transposase